MQLTVWDAHDEEQRRCGYGVAVVSAVEARKEPYVVRLEPAGHVAGRVLWNGEPRTWLLQATGRVDARGNLARNSDPGISHLPRIQMSTKSDASGAFRFDGLPPGEVVIRLQGGGGSFRLKGDGVVAQVGRDDVVLRLVATGTIRVRLHAPEGKAVRWAAASLAEYVAGGLAPAGSATAGSDQDQAYFDFAFEELDLEGCFRLETSVVVAGRSYLGKILDGISPRKEPYEVHVTAGLSITGCVVRRDGTPVHGAVVHYRPYPAGYFDPWTWEVGGKRYGTATTGKDGSFVLTGLVPADVVLTVVAPGFVVTGPPPRISTGARGLSLVVVAARRISGHVEDDVGGCVHDLSVTAVRARGEVGLWTPHEVMADGFFEVPGLDEGTWRIAGWNSERDGDPRYVLSEPVAAGTQDLWLVVRRGTPLTGVVRNADGTAIPGATVRLVGPWTNRRDRTYEDGAYAFAGVPPDSYVLEVRAPLGGEARRSFVVKAGSETLGIDVVVP